MVGERGRLAAIGTGAQLTLAALVVLLPIAWMVTGSFKDSTAVTAYPPQLLFRPTLANYVTLLQTMAFARYALNSLVVALGATALGLALGVPAAFAVSWNRMEWPAVLMLAARMAPGALFLLPWFVMFSAAGAIDTYWVLIATHAVIALPLVVWVMLPAFDALPRALVEAAQIDGCSELAVLLRVALPIAAPGVVVAAILAFVFTWNYFLFALVLSGFRTKTLIVASFNFVGEGVTDWGALMAAATLIALPPLVLALAVQKRLAAGLAAGAVKG
ncbi:MAG: carbohydrate ABC transporter permease [Rhodospirillales bacterium]|nr:carbohydrate ABC transporter permease [Rhodospirillales bacterium]MDE2198089.1 carbohydrate ABC transporter permease [Rhodospirillales bacterium]MDE2573908.1 carbohydrate ABC transporter permease [Rhodospirillales bacterium]